MGIELGKAYRLKYMPHAIMVVRELRDVRGVLCTAIGTLYSTRGGTRLESLSQPHELIVEEIGDEYVQPEGGTDQVLAALQEAKELAVAESNFDLAASIRDFADKVKAKRRAEKQGS